MHVVKGALLCTVLLRTLLVKCEHAPRFRVQVLSCTQAPSAREGTGCADLNAALVGVFCCGVACSARGLDGMWCP